MNREKFFVIVLFLCVVPLVAGAQTPLPSWAQMKPQTATKTLSVPTIDPVVSPVLPQESSTSVATATPPVAPKKTTVPVLKTLIFSSVLSVATGTATGTSATKKSSNPALLNIRERTEEEMRLGLSFITDESKRTALQQFVYSMSSLNDNMISLATNMIQKIEASLATAKAITEKKQLTNPDSAASSQAIINEAETAISYAKTVIEKQKTKLYEISVVQDDLFQTDIKDTKDGFKKDIKKVQDAVLNAKVAVRAVFELLRTIQ